MITVWDVYWVMQLDSIGSTVGFLAVACGVACLLVALIGMIAKASSTNFPELEISKREAVVGGICILAATRIGIAAIPLILASALIPSSKTAAAMILLPAITSDTVVETVAPEARELYELAKDALRSVAKDRPEKEGEAK